MIGPANWVTVTLAALNVAQVIALAVIAKSSRKVARERKLDANPHAHAIEKTRK